MWSIMVCRDEFLRGRSGILFTLENSIEMTLDRFICACCLIDSSKFQRGLCTPVEIQSMEVFRNKMADSPTKLWVLQPERGQRTVEHMMRQAQILDAEYVVIDQLTHVEHAAPKSKPRWEVVREIMQDLKVVASTSNPPLPVLTFHQISREGKKEADRRGFHSMEDYAEASEVERSGDINLTLYQGGDMRLANQALLQIVAARRVDLAAWLVDWHPSMGYVNNRGKVKATQ